MKVTVLSSRLLSPTKYTVLSFLDIAYMSAESSELGRSTVGRGGKAWSWCPLNWAGLGCRGLGMWSGEYKLYIAVTFHLAISRSLPFLPAYNYTRYLFLHIYLFLCVLLNYLYLELQIMDVVRFEKSCFELTIVSTT